MKARMQELTLQHLAYVHQDQETPTQLFTTIQPPYSILQGHVP